MADLAINILLTKLSIAGTELLHERMLGGENYVQAEVNEMLKLIRGATKGNDVFLSTIRDIVVCSTDQMAVKFDGSYTFEGETVRAVELEMKLAMIVNPTRSAIIDDYMVDAEAVKDELAKMGYKSSLLVRRNESSMRNRVSKKARFKPRRNVGQATKNRYKKENTWVPDVMRESIDGGCELPAVIIK